MPEFFLSYRHCEAAEPRKQSRLINIVKLWIAMHFYKNARNNTLYTYLVLIFLLVMLLLSANQVFAATTQEELAKTEKELKEAEARGKKLADENKVLAKKYSELTSKMVKTANALQASEARLSSMEDKIRIISEQISERTQSLAERKKELSVMIEAALKLSRTPKEAVILMPGDMMNNMKASRALKMTVDGIKSQSEIIHIQMTELESLKQTVTISKEEALAEKEKLEEQRKLLKDQIAEHTEIQKKLNEQQKAVQIKTKTLAKKANSLNELIKSLEQEKERQRKSQEDKEQSIEDDSTQPQGTKGELRSFTAAKGNIRVPAAGRLAKKYGEGKINETSKGIVIKTREDAQVTSPYDAEVLFTGPFREYGSMIILRHSDGFHTLLAGMNKIYPSVGDFLLEGEPIGDMGDEESGNRLYMELRSNNQPIDPAIWIRGLGKQ
ncbi:MAG: peptidoglycan DD-metalloendopeptidase family protein [Pseudomonadota bacterium]